jgi:ABC-type phosphate transport system ATPase subunit
LVDILGLTCVFVTHLIEQARRIGDNAVVLIGGQNVEEGSIDQVFTSPRDPRTRKFMKGELTDE